MKKYVQFFLITMVVVCSVQSIWAADVKGVIQEGVQDLKIEKGSPDLLALTNATYVKLNDKTTEGYVDMIQEVTGCSIGKKNFLFFHRPVTYALKIVLFRKDTKDAIVITCSGEKTEKVNLNIGSDKATTPEGWKQIQKKIGKLPDTFSMVTIANAWAKGAPYDFLRCCEFHNHLCPGVSTGYQIVAFALENYPLNKGESYA